MTRYGDARIGTAHDNDGEKAALCLALFPTFITDAIALYQKMSDRNGADRRSRSKPGPVCGVN